MEKSLGVCGPIWLVHITFEKSNGFNQLNLNLEQAIYGKIHEFNIKIY